MIFTALTISLQDAQIAGSTGSHNEHKKSTSNEINKQSPIEMKLDTNAKLFTTNFAKKGERNVFEILNGKSTI